MSIPVVSIKGIGLDFQNPDQECFERCGRNLFDAFENVGFVYIKDHGIDPQLIENAKKRSKEFFDLREERKLKTSISTKTEHGLQGYIAPGREVFTDTTKDVRHN